MAGFSKFVGQYLVRATLGGCVLYAFHMFKHTIKHVFGPDIALWFIVITASQYHFMFYLTRTLPNIMALPLVLLALHCWIRRQHSAFIWFSAAAIILFRSELAIFLGVILLYEVYKRRIHPVRVLKIGIPAGIVTLSCTVIIDSVMWDRLVWPEGEVFWFNSVLNKSSEWGTSPFMWYWYSAIPRALGFSVILVPVGGIIDSRAKRLLLPCLIFVGLFSFLPHKELRFIIYTFPLLNIAAACACNNMWMGRQKSLFRWICGMLAMGHIAGNIIFTCLLLGVAHNNYPGGHAIANLHKIESENSYVHVHIDNLAAQTGVSRFTQLYDNWIYNKTEKLEPGSDATKIFTHLLLEAKSKYSQNLKPYSDTHEIIDSVSGFSHISFNYNYFPPIRIKVKPMIFILRRKDGWKPKYIEECKPEQENIKTIDQKIDIKEDEMNIVTDSSESKKSIGLVKEAIRTVIKKYKTEEKLVQDIQLEHEEIDIKTNVTKSRLDLEKVVASEEVKNQTLLYTNKEEDVAELPAKEIIHTDKVSDKKEFRKDEIENVKQPLPKKVSLSDKGTENGQILKNKKKGTKRVSPVEIVRRDEDGIAKKSEPSQETEGIHLESPSTENIILSSTVPNDSQYQKPVINKKIGTKDTSTDRVSNNLHLKGDEIETVDAYTIQHNDEFVSTNKPDLFVNEVVNKKLISDDSTHLEQNLVTNDSHLLSGEDLRAEDRVELLQDKFQHLQNKKVDRKQISVVETAVNTDSVADKSRRLPRRKMANDMNSKQVSADESLIKNKKMIPEEKLVHTDNVADKSPDLHNREMGMESNAANEFAANEILDETRNVKNEKMDDNLFYTNENDNSDSINVELEENREKEIEDMEVKKLSVDSILDRSNTLYVNKRVNEKPYYKKRTVHTDTVSDKYLDRKLVKGSLNVDEFHPDEVQQFEKLNNKENNKWSSRKIVRSGPVSDKSNRLKSNEMETEDNVKLDVSHSINKKIDEKRLTAGKITKSFGDKSQHLSNQENLVAEDVDREFQSDRISKSKPLINKKTSGKETSTECIQVGSAIDNTDDSKMCAINMKDEHENIQKLSQDKMVPADKLQHNENDGKQFLSDDIIHTDKLVYTKHLSNSETENIGLEQSSSDKTVYPDKHQEFKGKKIDKKVISSDFDKIAYKSGNLMSGKIETDKVNEASNDVQKSESGEKDTDRSQDYTDKKLDSEKKYVKQLPEGNKISAKSKANIRTQVKSKVAVNKSKSGQEIKSKSVNSASIIDDAPVDEVVQGEIENVAQIDNNIESVHQNIVDRHNSNVHIEKTVPTSEQ